MAISSAAGFQIGSSDPIDSRLVLTKEEMLGINENTMPDVYFANCKDDGFIYVFNRSNTIDPATGKFRKVSSDAIVEVDTLPMDKENVIYKVGSETGGKLDLLSTDFTPQAVDVKGYALINCSHDFEFTYDGYVVNYAATEDWEFKQPGVRGHNCRFENSEVKVDNVPAFLWIDAGDGNSIAYIIDGKTSGPFSCNKSSIEILNQIEPNQSFTIPPYYITFKDENTGISGSYADDFTIGDFTYVAATRTLTYHDSSSTAFTSTIDVSKIGGDDLSVYAKDIRLLTEYDQGSIGKVKSVNNKEPDNSGNITIDIIKEVSELPTEKENILYSVIDDSKKEYSDIGTINVVEVPGSFLGDLYTEILTPCTCDVNGVEYQLMPSEETKLLFGSEDDLPALAYMIDTAKNQLHFRAVSDKPEVFVLRKVTLTPQNTGIYAKDVRLITENDSTDSVVEVENPPEEFENKVYLQKIGSSPWVIPVTEDFMYIDDNRNTSWLILRDEDPSLTKDVFDSFKATLNGYTWDFSTVEAEDFESYGDKVKLIQTELDDGSPVPAGNHPAVLWYNEGTKTLAFYICTNMKPMSVGTFSMPVPLALNFAISAHQNPVPITDGVSKGCIAKVIEGRDKDVVFPLDKDYTGLSFSYVALTKTIYPNNEDAVFLFYMPTKYEGSIFSNVWVKDTLVTSKDEFEDFKNNLPEPDLSKLVTLNTEQTVTAKKTLKDVDVNGNFQVRNIEGDIGSGITVLKDKVSISSEIDDEDYGADYGSVQVDGDGVHLHSHMSGSSSKDSSFDLEGASFTASAHTDNGNGTYKIDVDHLDIFALEDAKINNKNIVRSVQGNEADADGAVEIEELTELLEKVPAEASSTNKLADKGYVNDAVSSNSSNYISDNGNPFTSVEALNAYTGTVTHNDYAFVTGTDEAGNTYYDRYKASVSGTTVTWAKEYRMNNSSFTQAQWNAINSGITSTSYSGASRFVQDAGNTSNSIEIAYNGTGLTKDTATHFVAWGPSEHDGASKTMRDMSAEEAGKFIGKVNNAVNADNATNATNAGALSGFTKSDTQGWGVQTGGFITGMSDGAGGDIAFRKNCPASGQTSLVLDGTVYVQEGMKEVATKDAVGNVKGTFSGGVLTLNLL